MLNYVVYELQYSFSVSEQPAEDALVKKLQIDRPTKDAQRNAFILYFH